MVDVGDDRKVADAGELHGSLDATDAPLPGPGAIESCGGGLSRRPPSRCPMW
jgi:hypothetical protein